MSELYGVGETGGPASDAGGGTRHEAGGEQEFPDSLSSHAGGARDDDPGGYSDADIEDFLAAEELLPESRTRQEAAASTWDDATQPGDDDPGSFSGEAASEYDGDVAALLAAEERLPESRTRQEAADATWSDTSSSQEAELDTSTVSASPGQPDASLESPSHSDESADGTSGPFERQVAVRTTDGADVPVTVAYLAPEDRTIGDTTPTGVGRKPTGEEIFDMEGDESGEGLLDRLLNKATEEADDLHDTVGNAAETVHDLRLPGPAPGGGHVHEVHPVQEPAPPAGPAVSDLFGSAALVGVALLTGIRYGVRHFGKGDGR